MDVISPQQAADLLGVAETTVDNLVQEGTLPVRREGEVYALQEGDVLNYRNLRRERQYDFIAETSDPDAEAQRPETVREQLRRARRAAAEQRAEREGL